MRLGPRLVGPKTLLSADLRSLALFRAVLGLILVFDTVTRWSDLRAHYTDGGILPSAPYIEQFANWMHISLHLANGSVGWQGFLFSLTLLAGLCVTIGYRTRLATVAGWVLLVSVQNRNPMILNGGDVLFRLLFFWGMMLPLGARWSVDAALAPNGRPEVKTVFSGATVGVIMQVVFVYLTTVFLKTGSEWWPDGTASYYALSLDEFTTALGVWMKQWWTLLIYSTYAVWALECSAAFLILCPFYYVPVRLLTILALWSMHVSFDLSMRLGIFPYVDMASLLPLLPAPFWDWLGERLATPARKGLKLFYDGDCGFCKKTVLIFRELLLLPTTAVAPAQSEPPVAKLMEAEHSWVVVDADGTRHLRWDGFVTMLEHAPFLGPVVKKLPLRALTPVGDAAYNFVARRRAGFGKLTATLLPFRDRPPVDAWWLTNFVALFFVGYIGLWNMKTVPAAGVQIIEPWIRIGSILRLDQKWNMFAPFPLKEAGWFVIPGELKDGTKVDVLRQVEGEPSYDKPALVADTFPNARWRKYMMNIYERSKKDYRLYYGRWVCRTWNDGTDDAKRLAKFELVFMRVKTVLPGVEEKRERVSLWQHDCFKKRD